MASHHIQFEKLSTRERMTQVLARLQTPHFVPFVTLFTVEDWAVARARMALLPLDGKVPTGPDAVAEAALAGGLPRAKVEVKSVFGAEATVHIIQMGGRTIKQMEKRSG